MFLFKEGSSLLLENILSVLMQILYFLWLAHWNRRKMNHEICTRDHEITLKILEFILNSIEKLKPRFLLSSMCMFPESNGTKS